MSGSHRPSVLGKRYVVSSVHYLATMGGVRILENGGNAADAGVAVGICINVLQPGSTHFGGVAPIIYCPGSGAPVETISGLGRWPQAASIDYFRKYHGGDLPPGILRTLTPASPDAWLTALARFGTMTFEQVIQPALDLVENGHPVDNQFPRLCQRGAGRSAIDGCCLQSQWTYSTNRGDFFPEGSGEHLQADDRRRKRGRG